MNTLTKTNRSLNRPWRDFLMLDNIFDNTWLGKNVFPAVNISENEKDYVVEVVAPGFKKEDFKLKVNDDILTVSAEIRNEKTEDGKEYTRKEYNYSSFSRSFNLPDNVKDDKISAHYGDGILMLTLPKSGEQTKASKEIAIT